MKQQNTFSSILAVFGAILVGLGVIWLIAQNWHYMGKWLKIIVLLVSTSAAYFSGTLLRVKKHPRIAGALLLLGSLLYTWSIFLISQLFFTQATLQGTAWLFLLSWIGVLFAAYNFRSILSLVLGLALFLNWLVIQYMAFADFMRGEFVPGILAFCFLAAGAGLYGVSLWHRAGKHPFARTYQWWTAFYVLAFTYILSFQTLIQNIWPKGVTAGMPVMSYLIGLIIAAVILLSIGVTRAKQAKALHKKELTGMIIILLVLGALIGLTAVASNKTGYCNTKPCYELTDQTTCEAGTRCSWNGVSCDYPRPKECFVALNQTSCEAMTDCMWDGFGCSDKGCWNYRAEQTCNADTKCKWERGNYCTEYDACQTYNNQYDSCNTQPNCNWSAGNVYGEPTPLSVWFVWIVINIVFIGIILAVIGYATWMKLPKLVNLGIFAFALDIITRYIGFMIDLWGYTSLAVIFITGGIVLILGGLFIEKWRRKLIKQASGKNSR